ncbi:putative ankyrin repeat protein [Phytophthora citrophthora]|uniref:Ankyrin repeat protein n=1 Tax=Phytophthora citrophthora TaxID=4793 RepID=A0AAD9GRE0_9STRA|nr:putative ankyrin repeat protein [Phytophthora citrophthora]
MNPLGENMSVNPPLLAVALVFRSKRKFDGPDDVISIVSAYVDSSVEQPLHKACKFGSVALLDRIWNSTVDLESSGWGLWSVRNLLRTQKLYGKFEFSLCLLEAAKRNRVDIAGWLFERFPYGVRQKVVCEAAKAGALEILQFFRANGTVIRGEEEDEEEGDEWDEEREDWEKGRYIHFGGYDAAHATLAGHVGLVKWIYEMSKETNERRNDNISIHAVLSVGNIAQAEWIMDQVDMMVPEGSDALYGAAANGHVKTLQWFQEIGKYTKWDGILVKAAEAGQLEVVQWIIDRDRVGNTLGYQSEYHMRGYDTGLRRTRITSLGGEASLAIHPAAINGHLEVARYLRSKIEKPYNEAEEKIEERRLSQTIREISNCSRHLTFSSIDDIVKIVSGETMMLAAERGHLDVVKWLYTEYYADLTMNLFWIRGKVDKNGYRYSKHGYCSVVDATAGKGHLAIVQYLLQVSAKRRNEPPRKKQCPEAYPVQSNRHEAPTIEGRCTKIAMDAAAANGHLDVVKWLHVNYSQGCTTRAMDLAACNGHLETVKKLHANRREGCTTKAMDGAGEYGHLHVVKWLHEHRSEGCTNEAMDGAADRGHFEMMKWLHENRPEIYPDAAMKVAPAHGHLNIVKWLHKHRATCTTQAMDRAAQGGHLRVLRWLFENQKEGFSSSALHDSAKEGQFEAVLILHNIAQQGLAKEVRAMDADQANASISKFYLEIRHHVWTPDSLRL